MIVPLFLCAVQFCYKGRSNKATFDFPSPNPLLYAHQGTLERAYNVALITEVSIYSKQLCAFLGNGQLLIQRLNILPIHRLSLTVPGPVAAEHSIAVNLNQRHRC